MSCPMGLCLSVYVFTFVLGFPSNLLAFYTFCKKVRRKPTPIDVLLLNLTVSDILFLLILPFKMREVSNDMEWDMPYALCPLSGFVFYMTIYNSTLFLTAVSVERYLGVAFPIQHSLKRHPAYAVAASVFIWLLTFVHLSIVVIVPFIEDAGGDGAAAGNATLSVTPSPSPQKGQVCYEDFSPAQLAILLPVRLYLALFLFLIPFLICSFCYINFIRILSRLQHIDRRRRLRAIGMALGTLVVFVLCFAPYNVSHIIGHFTKMSPRWRDTALLFSTFNACLDPLIFYFSSSAVRGTVGSVMEGVKSRLSGCLSCGVCRGGGVGQGAKNKERKQEEINTF